MKSRLALAVSAVVLLPIALSGCGGTSEAGGDQDTIKIALIPPTSGAFAQFGTDSVNAWKLAAEIANENGGVAGREVEIIVKSTDSTPETTLRVAREAVTKDGAQFISSVMSSPENAALNTQLENIGALSLNAHGKDDGLNGENCSPYAFQVVQSTTMDINALAQSIEEMPGETWAIQAVDIVTGHTAADVFSEAVEAAGKEVVLEQFAPLNTTDFGSYITSIKESGADALFSVEFGADGIAFVQQMEQFELSQELDTVLGFNMVSEPFFETLGTGIAGFYNNVGFDPAADDEMTREFVSGYTDEYGSVPYFLPADAYLSAQALFAAIEEADSTDPDEVAEALRGLSFDSIVGEVSVREEDNKLLRPSYLGQVVKDAEGPGGLAFEILSSADGSSIAPEPDGACKF